MMSSDAVFIESRLIKRNFPKAELSSFLEAMNTGRTQRLRDDLWMWGSRVYQLKEYTVSEASSRQLAYHVIEKLGLTDAEADWATARILQKQVQKLLPIQFSVDLKKQSIRDLLANELE